MSEKTKISWCDHTFNPWWGCEHVSPACDHCYARSSAKRFGPDCFGDNPRRFFDDRHWREPLKWDRAAETAGVRRRVFAGSMCDVFEDRPELMQERLRLFTLIDRCQNLDWLLLTKRPANIDRLMPPLVTQYVPEAGSMSYLEGVRENLWLGVTAENQTTADERIPILLQTPAAVRFVSIEPMLGPIDLRRIRPWHPGHGPDGADALCGGSWGHDCVRRMAGDPSSPGYCNHSDAPTLDWVIAGGESGPGARQPHPDWFRALRDQCYAAGVPFFFKQWGSFKPDVFEVRALERVGYDLNQPKGGCLLDKREHKDFPASN